ncbi:MAG: alpha/beta hydrolase [Blautia sp.]|nr:alpha/beta hydrolase [Blautia sp.]
MALTKEQKAEWLDVLKATGGNREVMLNSRVIPAWYKDLLGQVEREELLLSFPDLPSVRVILTRCPAAGEGCPLHINFHGGGFILPQNEDDDLYCAHLALGMRGIVVDVDYAKSDENPYPAAARQAYEVTKWVFSKAESWGADVSRISAGGHSAGGNLVEYICMKAGKTGDFTLCLALLDYAATDNHMAMEMENASRMQAFSMLYADGDEALLKDPYVSPIYASKEDLKAFPPTVIAEAGNCPFTEINRRFGAMLTEAGVSVSYLSYPESRHGFSVRMVDEWQKAQEDFIDVLVKAGR